MFQQELNLYDMYKGMYIDRLTLGRRVIVVAMLLLLYYPPLLPLSREGPSLPVPNLHLSHCHSRHLTVVEVTMQCPGYYCRYPENFSLRFYNNPVVNCATATESFSLWRAINHYLFVIYIQLPVPKKHVFKIF